MKKSLIPLACASLLICTCIYSGTSFEFFGQKGPIARTGRYIPTESPGGAVFVTFFNDSAILFFEGISHSNLTEIAFSDTLGLESCKKCIEPNFYPCGYKMDCSECEQYKNESCRYRGKHSVVYFNQKGFLKCETILPATYEKHIYTLMKIKSNE